LNAFGGSPETRAGPLISGMARNGKDNPAARG